MKSFLYAINCTSDELDDIVSDAFLAQASNANNGGMSVQLEALIQMGWTETQIFHEIMAHRDLPATLLYIDEAGIEQSGEYRGPELEGLTLYENERPIRVVIKGNRLYAVTKGEEKA